MECLFSCCKFAYFTENEHHSSKTALNEEFFVDNREYKVITSNTPSFASTEKMQQVLAEEAQAGWELEEKYDSYKIRVGRDKSARANDSSLSIDPYRTNVGVNNVLYLAGAAIVTIIVIYAIIQAAAMSVV